MKRTETEMKVEKSQKVSVSVKRPWMIFAQALPWPFLSGLKIRAISHKARSYLDSSLSYALQSPYITIVSYEDVLIGVLFKYKHSLPYLSMLDKQAFTTEFIRLTKVIYSVVFKSHGELNVQINLQQNDFDKLHINLQKSSIA